MTDALDRTSPKTDISGLERFQRRDQSTSPRASIAANQAVLYLRVSTERQLHTAADIDADGNSIATQREAALKKVRALKATVLNEFVEPGTSAQTIAKRAIFKEMLRYIDDHPEVTYVVIYMRSRVFRNFTDAAITKRALLEKGVRLVSAKEEFGEGYMADAMEAITDIMNEVQVRQSGEDIKVKMRHKAESGGTVGRAKLGYLNVRKDFDGRLVNTIDIDPERAPLIKWAFEAYASGEYTVVTLQAALAEQGLTTRPSVRWSAQPISHSQLALIMRDPYYTGVIRYKGDLFPGRHEPLITKELFLRVQDVMSERAQRGQRDRVHHHFLKGLLYCQRCAKNGHRSRLVYTEAAGNGGIYSYFLCRGRQEGHCDLPYLPVDELEDAVARRFAGEVLPANFMLRIREEVQKALEDDQESDREVRANLSKQIKKLDVREERLLDLASDGELSTPKLKSRLQTVSLERAHLKERLAQTDADLQRGAQTLLSYLDLLTDPGRLYKDSPDSVRRHLLEAFFAELQADIPDRVEVHAVHRAPVQELHDAAQAYREEQAQATVGRENPRLSTGASAFRTSVGLLADLFRPNGSSKTTLVAGTGFEPATSGL